MTNLQLYLVIGIPLIVNNAIAILLFRNLRDDLRNEMAIRFEAINQRFDDMKDLWRAELRRMEEVFDARLKHLEEDRKRQ